MFKASFPRHARLGNVAHRQLSSIVSRRPAVLRIQSLEQQQPCARVSLRTSVLKALTPRFYSANAVAEQRHSNGSESNVSSERITKFADLGRLGVHQKLISSITEGMRYQDMTEVQSLTINSALSGTDLVAQAKTGTGKTLAFLVPVIQRLLEEHPELAQRNAARKAAINDVKAIIMSPTRELAEQIGVEAKKLVSNTGIVVQTAVGGTRKRESLFTMQRQGCHILVATPGRLEDLLSDRDSGLAAPNLKAFVLDEADRMLDVGFSDAIRNILDLLPSVQDVDRQTLLYSATIPRDVVHLAKSLVKTDNFEFVQTISQDEAPTHERVPQHIVPCVGYENWFPSIMEIANKAAQNSQNDPSAPPFKAIVFFSNTATVQFAYNVFNATKLAGMGGMPIFDIHSKLNQSQRTRSAESFRRAKSGILFSSDVTARGMDFPGVTHVIQVGLPPDRDQYIHRVGRTGRAGASGEGYLLLAKPEIEEARARLPGLPIKPNHTIEAAKVNLATETPSGETAEYFEDLERAYKRTRPYEFSAVYYALLGQKFSRRLEAGDAVQLLNNWSEFGLKREEVPALSARTAHTRGLARVPGIRIGHDDDGAGLASDRGRSGGSGGFGDRRGFGGRSDRDQFGSRGGNRGRNSFEDNFSSAARDRDGNHGGRRGDNRGFRSSF